jgi:hypothetical protein
LAPEKLFTTIEAVEGILEAIEGGELQLVKARRSHALPYAGD